MLNESILYFHNQQLSAKQKVSCFTLRPRKNHDALCWLRVLFYLASLDKTILKKEELANEKSSVEPSVLCSGRFFIVLPYFEPHR
jgi:hypothetical protein